MTVEIKRHPNYGKDLLTLQIDARFSFLEAIRMYLPTLRMINRIRIKIGLRKTLLLFKDVKLRVKEVLESDDLSTVRFTGISERDLAEMVERIALGETLIKYLGLEKAITIRTSLSEEIAPVFSPKLFPTYEDLRPLPSGYLHNLKIFLMSFASQNTQKTSKLARLQMKRKLDSSSLLQPAILRK